MNDLRKNTKTLFTIISIIFVLLANTNKCQEITNESDVSYESEIKNDKEFIFKVNRFFEKTIFEYEQKIKSKFEESVENSINDYLVENNHGVKVKNLKVIAASKVIADLINSCNSLYLHKLCN